MLFMTCWQNQCTKHTWREPESTHRALWAPAPAVPGGAGTGLQGFWDGSSKVRSFLSHKAGRKERNTGLRCEGVSSGDGAWCVEIGGMWGSAGHWGWRGGFVQTAVSSVGHGKVFILNHTFHLRSSRTVATGERAPGAAAGSGCVGAGNRLGRYQEKRSVSGPGQGSVDGPTEGGYRGVPNGTRTLISTCSLST